jgi:D-amino-acid oxidase
MSASRNRNETVLVVGAGVSGLTCALCLKQHGFGVTVIADHFAPRVTSVVAGALWEWPPAVCGYHQDQQSLIRSKSWCIESYRHFAELSRDSTTGVFMRTATFYFKQPVEKNPLQLAKMNELKEHVDEFVHDRGLIAANQVNMKIGIRDAYAHWAPLVDTDAYMAWLLNQVRKAGCLVLPQKISGNLIEQEASLRKRFQADAIVNCTGLGARELVKDDLYPLRGALIRIINDGRTMPRITQAHCVARDETSSQQDMVFIVPRGHDRLVLGGLTEPDEWSLDIDMCNHDPIRKMYERCVEFLPVLKHAQIDESEPVRVGLRPMRRQNVRLEREPGTRIIHNYGHGGSGVTLSWGCAAEVVESVERLMATIDIGE